MPNIKILICSKLNSGNTYLDQCTKYVRQQKDVEIIYNSELFWSPDFSYDIVHIQWIEELFSWGNISKEDCEAFFQTIKLWKTNSKIVFTLHDWVRHVGAKEGFIKIRDYLIKNSNAVIHLDSWSKNLIKEEFNISLKTQYIIEHPIYETFSQPLEEDVKIEMKIPPESFVVLAYGAIRTEEERRLIITFFNKIHLKNKILIVPRWNFPSPFIKPLSIFNRMFYFIHPRYRLSSQWKNNHEEAKLFSITDIVFLPRIKSLNSGIIPLSFAYKKVVVGPNTGNIGNILHNTNNPVYDLENDESLDSAIEKAIALHNKNKGIENFLYAKKHWDTYALNIKLYKLYLKILNLKKPNTV